MKRETALYIKADPFNFNEMDIVKKAISQFGFVHILLDRRNVDRNSVDYQLSFQDRQDIIQHEMKATKIQEYDIVPVDVTISQKIRQIGITNLILNYDDENEERFRTFDIMRRTMDGEVNLILMNGNRFYSQGLIRDIVKNDETMTEYRKYFFDYAFGKLKFKKTYKIALTGGTKEQMDIISDVFRERGFSVIDIDEAFGNSIKDQQVNHEIVKQVANLVLGTFDSKIVVRGSDIEDLGISSLFNSTVYVDRQYIPMTDNEKDCYISFTRGCDNARNQMIRMFNSRYSKV